jgi:hypothetical protein
VLGTGPGGCLGSVLGTGPAGAVRAGAGVTRAEAGVARSGASGTEVGRSDVRGVEEARAWHRDPKGAARGSCAG